MYLSVYSLFTALLWVTIFTKVVSLLRKRMPYLQHFSLHVFLLLLLLCILRILFPLELPYTVILNSEKILPAIQSFSRKTLFSYGSLHLTPALFLIAVWFTGAAIFLIKRIREYCRLKRALDLLPASDNGHLYHLLAETGLQDPQKKIKIIVHKSFAVPTAAGYLHPVILLPDICLDDEELLGILIHEAAHIRSKHHLVKLVMELICICFWWDPFLKNLSIEAAHAMEMHSDQAVCAKLNEEQQKKYLHAITKIFINRNQTMSSSAFTCGLFEHSDNMDLQQRFRMILEKKYQSKTKKLPVIAVLALCTFLLSYAVIPQPYSEPTDADYGPIDKSPDQNFFYIETNDGYDLYEYPNRFLDHIYSQEDCLPWLKIYKDMDDVEKK